MGGPKVKIGDVVRIHLFRWDTMDTLNQAQPPIWGLVIDVDDDDNGGNIRPLLGGKKNWRATKNTYPAFYSPTDEWTTPRVEDWPATVCKKMARLALIEGELR